VIESLCLLQCCRTAFSSEDMYCIHFRFIIDMSNTQAVPAKADAPKREEVDEDDQV
jgi:hypothetical protein